MLLVRRGIGSSKLSEISRERIPIPTVPPSVLPRRLSSRVKTCLILLEMVIMVSGRVVLYF